MTENLMIEEDFQDADEIFIPDDFFTPKEVANVLNIPEDIARDLLRDSIDFELSEFFTLAKYKERKALDLVVKMLNGLHELYASCLDEVKSKYPALLDENEDKPAEPPKSKKTLP